MSAPQVFGRLFAPTATDYDEAVREIILALQKRTIPVRHTQKYIAERCGVSPDTIHNAQEMHHSLSGWVVARIRFEFGEEAVAPFAGLGGVSEQPDDKLADALKGIRNILDETLPEAEPNRRGVAA